VSIFRIRIISHHMSYALKLHVCKVTFRAISHTVGLLKITPYTLHYKSIG